MRIFSKQESIALTVILSILFVVSYFNFAKALVRSRDLERRNDIGAITKGLEDFRTDFASYPQSTKEGLINACNGGCVWGKDPLRDINDLTYPAYMNVIPLDPRTGDGYSYLYFSNGRRFQIYATLEDAQGVEYDPKIVAMNLKCGTKICNFGRSSPETPLDKSIEQYENELIQEQLRLRKLQLGK
ncbi:MAG TPA: hypothetical protein VF185_03385 [Patescibacteria group bacterium]